MYIISVNEFVNVGNRRESIPGVRRLVVPAAGSEAYDSAEMRLEAVQVILKCLGADLHEHLHVNLRFSWIVRHTIH